MRVSTARTTTALFVFALCVVLLGSLALPSRDVLALRTQSYVYPLMGPRLSSDYGTRIHPVRKSVRHHHGMDLAAPEGAPIRSIAAGRVVYSHSYAGYGNLVVVQHEGGLTSHYGHCKALRVQVGERVAAGQILATVGSTGISTGPHLHFEVRVNGLPADPERIIPGLALPGEG